MNEFLNQAMALQNEGTRFISVTLTSVRGGAPQELGAKAIITEQGLYWGTVGGGKIEAHCIRKAQEILSTKNAPRLESFIWNLQRDIGMTCGGEVTMIFETYGEASWKVVVFGAGHVSQALVRTLLTLDCQVTCIDPRPEWIEKLPSSPKLKTIHALQPKQLVSTLDPSSYFVVMSQGHATDVPILFELFTKYPDARYIGCMGSDIKAKKMKNDLLAQGISMSALERFRSPIGMDIGGNTPAEIAISVAAQLLECRSSKAT